MAAKLGRIAIGEVVSEEEKEARRILRKKDIILISLYRASTGPDQKRKEG